MSREFELEVCQDQTIWQLWHFHSSLIIAEGDSPCWIWKGRKRSGYGYVMVQGRQQQAHRYAYELYRSPIPAGMVIRHICNQPACCNPEHLQVGTQHENMQDMIDAGRQGWRRSLTDAQVRTIRKSSDRVTDLARRYSVSPATISKVKNFYTYRHVQG